MSAHISYRQKKLFLGRHYQFESQSAKGDAGVSLRESEKRRRMCENASSNVDSGENRSFQSMFSKRFQLPKCIPKQGTSVF
jgi:hypothetical protein